MWGDDEALELWFDDVKKSRVGSDGASMEKVPEASDLTQNAYVDELLGRDR